MKIAKKIKASGRTGQKAFRVLENRCIRKYDNISPDKVRLAFRAIMALFVVLTVMFLWRFGGELLLIIGGLVIIILCALIYEDLSLHSNTRKMVKNTEELVQELQKRGHRQYEDDN
ncbi:TPA: hypothetical protein LVM22_001155 [Klebsiella oxytoca]|nr:hypothetical protein [Klebsiella oxytoca]